MQERVFGLDPVYDENSRILILGSFPSVQSRKTDFYYGNPQNRFWKLLASFFGEPLPVGKEGKKAFVLRHGIALWDVVTSCRIVGSADDTITDYTRADLTKVLTKAKIELVLLNGKKALSVFEEGYKDCGVPYKVMPSTSPANPRYKEEIWRRAFNEVFRSVE